MFPKKANDVCPCCCRWPEIRTPPSAEVPEEEENNGNAVATAVATLETCLRHNHHRKENGCENCVKLKKIIKRQEAEKRRRTFCNTATFMVYNPLGMLKRKSQSTSKDRGKRRIECCCKCVKSLRNLIIDWHKKEEHERKRQRSKCGDKRCQFYEKKCFCSCSVQTAPPSHGHETQTVATQCGCRYKTHFEQNARPRQGVNCGCRNKAHGKPKLVKWTEQSAQQMGNNHNNNADRSNSEVLERRGSTINIHSNGNNHNGQKNGLNQLFEETGPEYGSTFILPRNVKGK